MGSRFFFDTPQVVIKHGNTLDFAVKTNDAKVPFMIIAPTMFLPEAVKPQNCFFAMSAILNIYTKHKNKIQNIYCPGLGTGVGQVDPYDSAKEMKAAYLLWY